MYRRTTLTLTAALVLLALLVGLPGTTVQARAKKTPTPTETPTASATATASAPATATPTPTPTPTAQPTSSGAITPLTNAIRSMGKLQTLIEFYYMSTGTYPGTLQELNQQYNDHAPKDARKVSIPTDPASGKPFVYSSNNDGTAYSLKAPDPSAYGVTQLELTNIDWGWMNSIADERKKQQLRELCSLYVKGLAKALDQYARDHKNELPDSLDVLVPKLVKKLPVCPVSGKPYIYKKTARGYEILCPDPKMHELEVLEYSSTEGFKAR